MRSTTICAANVARIMTNMVDPRFHSGRTTMRSSTTPDSATIAIAPIAAIGNGRPSLTIPALVSMPPSITKAPCAKLTMPLAL